MKEEISKITEDFFVKTFANENSLPDHIEAAWGMVSNHPKLVSYHKHKELLLNFVKRTYAKENATLQELEVAGSAATLLSL